MSYIYETPHFILESKDSPEVDRLDGGHLVINPKVSVPDRTYLEPRLVIELARLTQIAGKAMTQGLKNRGIDLGRINYQDNGNWRQELHIHLYGRAKNAKYQVFGNPIIPGNKPEYSPLNSEDISAIKKEVEYLFSLPSYSDSVWGLTS